jgi:hypothetical protein
MTIINKIVNLFYLIKLCESFYKNTHPGPISLADDNTAKFLLILIVPLKAIKDFYTTYIYYY